MSESLTGDLLDRWLVIRWPFGRMAFGGLVQRVMAKVWNDLRHGREVDLYAALLVSIVVVVLTAFGVTSPKVILSLILVVLGLLSVALLVLRDQNAQLALAAAELRQGSALAKDFFVDEDVTELLAQLASASSAWLWGATLQTHVPLFEEPLRVGLRQGKRYRVMLIAESSNALKLAAFRTTHMGEIDFDKHLESNLGRLDRLKIQESPGRLEVGTIDYLGPYVLYIFNPQSDDARVFVRLTTFRGSRDVRPTFWLNKRDDPVWCDRFISEFETVWSAADKRY